MKRKVFFVFGAVLAITAFVFFTRPLHDDDKGAVEKSTNEIVKGKADEALVEKQKEDGGADKSKSEEEELKKAVKELQAQVEKLKSKGNTAEKATEKKKDRTLKRKKKSETYTFKPDQEASEMLAESARDLRDEQETGLEDISKKTEEKEVDNAIVDVPATYPGGEAAILRFIGQNLEYPEVALKQGVHGKVVVRFKVEKDGTVSDVIVRKGISHECDSAVVACVKKLNRFIPAKANGRAVPVWITIPITFGIKGKKGHS